MCVCVGGGGGGGGGGIQCGAIVIWSVHFRILMKDTPYLARDVWGFCFELNL